MAFNGHPRSAMPPMGERFPAESIVVIDDTKAPQANDFVAGVLPGTQSALVRQWVDAADRHFPVPFNRSYQAIKFGPDFRLLGVIVEAIVLL